VTQAYFFDSSALVKRYVTEIGSDWVKFITAPKNKNQLFVARITWVEVLCAFARLRREGNLVTVNVTTAIQACQYDFDIQYQVIELDLSLTQQAGQLAQKHPLRAYDSIQLASALKLQSVFAQFAEASFTFVAADKRLLAVALAEGILVDNPDDHS